MCRKDSPVEALLLACKSSHRTHWSRSICRLIKFDNRSRRCDSGRREFPVLFLCNYLNCITESLKGISVKLRTVRCHLHVEFSLYLALVGSRYDFLTYFSLPIGSVHGVLLAFGIAMVALQCFQISSFTVLAALSFLPCILIQII